MSGIYRRTFRKTSGRINTDRIFGDDISADPQSFTRRHITRVSIFRSSLVRPNPHPKIIMYKLLVSLTFPPNKIFFFHSQLFFILSTYLLISVYYLVFEILKSLGLYFERAIASYNAISFGKIIFFLQFLCFSFCFCFADIFKLYQITRSLYKYAAA